MKAYLAILVLAAACGSDSKSNNDANTGGSNDAASSIDAKEFLDAPPNVPAMITISGTAQQVGLGGTTPEANVKIEAFRTTDETTPVATAMTNAQGQYSLSITTNGAPVDGYLKATKANLATTYLYPPAPLIADFGNGSINMVTPGNLGNVYTFLGTTQDTNKGTVALVVVDAAMMPVSGATVSSNPAAGKYGYNCSNCNPVFPSQNATSTAPDGIGYMLNVDPTGNVSVTASKTGTTFLSHNIKARAGALTTTVVTP